MKTIKQKTEILRNYIEKLKEEITNKEFIIMSLEGQIHLLEIQALTNQSPNKSDGGTITTRKFSCPSKSEQVQTGSDTIQPNKGEQK